MNTAVVLAGGVGSRVGAALPKQFIEVLGKPIMIYTLEKFQNNKNVDSIIIVCVSEYMKLAKELCDKYEITKVIRVVEGGETFTDSCMNGVLGIPFENTENDIVLISSADRPFVSDAEIDDSIEKCKLYGSGIAARPCSLCMFKVGEERSHSSQYLRDDLVQTATPWTFKRSKLVEALNMYKRGELADCENYPVAIYAAAGNEIFFSVAYADNFKITEKIDVLLMEQILRMRRIDILE